VFRPSKSVDLSLAILIAAGAAAPVAAQTAPATTPPGAPAGAAPQPASTPAPTSRPAPRKTPPAESPPAKSPKADANDDGDDEVVVSANRPQRGAVIGDIKPELQLAPADIQSYGVSTVTELLNELTRRRAATGVGAPRRRWCC